MRAMSFRKAARSWKWTIPGLVVVALFAALANPRDQGVTSPADFEYVQRVVDGDTLVLGTGERVRLIGVDTPETKRPKAPVTVEELLVSSLAQTDALAKLLIEKGIITQQEFLAKISEERATYQAMFKPTPH